MFLKLKNNNRFLSTNMITAAFIKIETLFLPHLKKLNNFLCLFLKVTSENDFFYFQKNMSDIESIVVIIYDQKWFQTKMCMQQAFR